ncbi:MAG: hypothetical protein ACLFO1_09135 [Spirochaetaceae bacterium]
MKYHPCSAFLALALLLLTHGAPGHGQTSIGGEVRYRVGAEIPVANPGEALLSHVGAAAVSLSAGSACGEVNLRARLEQDFGADSTDIDLESGEVVGYLGDYLVSRAGFFAYQPSVSDLLPALDFFKRRDLEAYFAGRVEKAIIPAPLLQLTGLAGPLYARLTILPVEVEVPFVDAGSPWFPNLGFPEEINVGSPSSTTMRLSEIVVDRYPAPTLRVDAASYQGELGGSVGLIDFTIIYYHGQDLRPRYTATLEFPQGLFQDYRVRLTPVPHRLDAIGGNILAVLGPVRTYGEIVYRHADVIVVEEVTVTESGFQTKVHETPTWTYTLGASYRRVYPALLITAEYTNSGIEDRVTRMIEPSLEHAAALTATWSPFDGRLAVTAFGLMSLLDYSFNTSLRTELWSPDGSLGVRLTAPVFWGADDTELGQYADLVLPSAEVVYRF